MISQPAHKEVVQLSSLSRFSSQDPVSSPSADFFALEV